jgi:AraC family transcriptional regulator
MMRRVSDPKSTKRTPAAEHQTYEARLLRVLSYIYDHLDGDLSLDVVADVACMSPHHWHRVFRAMTGETLADAIRRVRLLKAANALVREGAPVADIAERFGYPNLASFSRAFSAQHGKPPGAFRDESHERAATLRRATGGHPMYPVIVQNLPACRAAGVPHVGPYEGLGQAFQKLGAVIAARNLFSHVESLIAVYHDAPGSKAETDLRSHAAVIAGSGFPQGIEGLDYFALVGGKHAILQHRGPYATLGSAYEWLYGKWLPQSGEEPRNAPPIELYVNDPRTTPPDQLRTDVRLPLA